VGHFKRAIVMPDISGSDEAIKAKLGTHFGPHRMMMLDARPMFEGESSNYLFKWAFEFKPMEGFAAHHVTVAMTVNLGDGFSGKFEPCADLAAALSLCKDCVHSTLPDAKIGEGCICKSSYSMRGHQIAAIRQDKQNKSKGYLGHMQAIQRKAARGGSSAGTADSAMQG